MSKRSARNAKKRLKARQVSVPESGIYRNGNGDPIFMRKPGSQNGRK